MALAAFALLDTVAAAGEGVEAASSGVLYEEAYNRDYSSVKKNLYERAYKRMKTEMDTDKAVETNAVFGPGYCVEANIKRGKTKKTMKSMLKRIEAASYNVISRWQSLTCGSNDPLNATGLAHSLSYFTQDNENGNVWMPMYAFDLTCLPSNRHNVSGNATWAQSTPFYRMYKEAGTNMYKWFPVSGVKNNPDGVSNSLYWSTESSDAGDPYTIDTYTLDWVNARLMIRGAEDRDTKIDIMEVKFSDLKAGPLRQFQRTFGSPPVVTTAVEDVAPTGDDANEIITFWDHYFASRTVHPFRTSYLAKGQVDKIWKIIRHKKIHFPPMNAANTVTGSNVGFTKCENMFNRYDYFINLRSNNPATSSAVTKSVVGSNSVQPAGYVQINKYGNDAGTQNTLYSPYAKDHWLIISACAYDKTLSVDVDHTKFASFDLCVRQKITSDVL